MVTAGGNPVCRLLPLATADGPWQMAADEVMLESAATGQASLRFYRWSEPTLSLGYFQPESVRRTNPALAGLPYVRRATGGGALVHDREITYALALPLGAPWHDRAANWVARFHRVAAVALRSPTIGVKSVDTGQVRKLGESLCFLDQTADDLLVLGRKVLGSARRKHKSAVLQHGGILLAQSQFTPELPGLSELTGLPVEDFASLPDAIIGALVAETGWRFEPADWTESEVCRRTELISEKYASPAWSAKR
jgi:lipoate-protein ligase A